MHGNMFDKGTFDIARITIIQQQNYFSAESSSLTYLTQTRHNYKVLAWVTRRCPG